MARDWPSADALRRQIADLGYEITDTLQGPRSYPLRTRRNTKSSS